MPVEFVISEIPEKDVLAVEIWIDGELFAEVFEENRVFVAIHGRESGQPWELEKATMDQLIVDASNKLRSYRGFESN